MSRRRSVELAALLPWLGAALLWFAVIEPLRAEQSTRLNEQSLIRRSRVKAERASREAQALSARIDAAMATACTPSSEAAALRQRTVGATAGLGLAPVSLAVTGGANGGAILDAAGRRSAVRELLRRLGDPSGGGFLKTVTIRGRDDSWSVSAATGLLGSLPSGLRPAAPPCGETALPDVAPSAAPTPAPPRPRPAELVTPVRVSPVLDPGLPPVASEPAPPFTLVAFLESVGKPRVSIRLGGEIRVVSVGDRVDGWICASIDRDEGAVFTSPTQPPFVLRASRDAGR